MAAAPPPAAFPKAPDSEHVRIALGRRGGDFRQQYSLLLAVGICNTNKVVKSRSSVISWVGVDDGVLDAGFIRTLADDCVPDFPFRRNHPHYTNNAYELVDAHSMLLGLRRGALRRFPPAVRGASSPPQAQTNTIPCWA